MHNFLQGFTKQSNFKLLFCFCLFASASACDASTISDLSVQMPQDQYAVLAFHDIREDVVPDTDRDPYAMNTARLAHFFDWIQTHHLHPVSLQQIIDAKSKQQKLPTNAVLLTFDDGPESNYTTLFPLLKIYHYPALLALETGWITGEVSNNAFGKEGFVTWSQLREMRDSGLIEFATHTHDLHRGILANPQGNLEPAALTRLYDAITHQYETAEHYKERIKHDLILSCDLIEKNLGVRPRAVVWPYGAMNDLTRGIARSVGLPISFSLGDDRINDVQNVDSSVSRILAFDSPNAVQIEQKINNVMMSKATTKRAVQVQLDDIYDPDPIKQEVNLGKLLDRIKALNIKSVYLKAFYDPTGDGVASQLYFPNRHLPMRADLFNRVAWQLSTRVGVKVYAWLPLLAFKLPDSSLQKRLSISSNQNNEQISTQIVHDRLSPFSPESIQIMGDIYEDLGINTHSLNGILIKSDTSLMNDEDASRCGSDPRWPKSGQKISDCQHLTQQQKNMIFMDVGDIMVNRLKRFQNYSNPFSVIRSLDVPNLSSLGLDSAVQVSFNQELALFIQHYDEVALVIKPNTDESQYSEKSLKILISDVVNIPHGLDKAIFDLQAKDSHNHWVNSLELRKQMQTLEQLGMQNIAYFPDDFLLNQPKFDVIYGGFSLNQFPAFYKEPLTSHTIDKKVVAP